VHCVGVADLHVASPSKLQFQETVLDLMCRIPLPCDADHVAHAVLLCNGHNPCARGLCGAHRGHDTRGACTQLRLRCKYGRTTRCSLCVLACSCAVPALQGARPACACVRPVAAHTVPCVLSRFSVLQVYTKAIVPIGALFSINLWLGNTAYLYLSVAFVQMLKVCALLCTLPVS